MLLTALHSNPRNRFASWDLSSQDLDDETSVLLAKYITSSVNLTSLDLRTTRLSAVGAKIVGKALRASKSMTTITMEDGVPLTIKQLQGTAEAGLAHKGGQLQEAGQEGGSQQQVGQQEGSQQQPQQQEGMLNLAGKRIGPLSLSVVAMLVVDHPCLAQLNLARNRLCGLQYQESTRRLAGEFTSGGLAVLADALPRCRTLTALNLSNNALVNQGKDLGGLRQVMSAIGRCASLKHCNLSANELGHAGVEAALESMGAAASLAELDVHNNVLDEHTQMELMVLVGRLKRENALPPGLLVIYKRSRASA